MAQLLVELLLELLLLDPQVGHAGEQLVAQKLILLAAGGQVVLVRPQPLPTPIPSQLFLHPAEPLPLFFV